MVHRRMRLVDELRAKTPQASTTQTARPRPALTVEQYVPFPVGVLPLPLRSYVNETALALGCDAAYVALPALAACAGAIGTTRRIMLKRSWTEPAVLWTCIVGESGTLKSPAIDAVMRPIYAAQRVMVEQHQEAMDQHRQELLRYEAARRRCRKDGSDPGAQPDEPTCRRTIASDTTIEALASILAANPRGILVARDELAGWLGSYTRYKSGSDLPLWLEAHRAGAWVVDRKSGGTLYIRRAAVSILGGIQPGILARALTAEQMDAGLGARLLAAMPPRQPKVWRDLDVDPATERAYGLLVERLLALQGAVDDTEPATLKLSPEAMKAWQSWYGEWAQVQADAEGEMASAMAKLEGYAARLALVHHVVRCQGAEVDDLVPVEVASIEAGATLARWFAGEVRRVYDLLTAKDDDRAIHRLVDLMRSRGGGITARDLCRANRRRYPTAEAANEALDRLVQSGLAAWQSIEPQSGGHTVHRCELSIPDAPDA